MPILKTLYNRDSSGRVRQWAIEVEDDKYRTIAGLVEGEKVTSGWTTTVGKNVGKANQTNGQQQAESEADSEIKKKLSQGGYFEKVEDIDGERYFEPMLATPLDKIKGFKPVAVFSQPKLDGVRCIATSHGLYSRQGKKFDSVPHIARILEPYFKAFPEHIIDGELYNHDLKNDFNEIISNVRKQKSTAEDFAKAEQLVEYHVYDCYRPEAPTQPFSGRTEWLQQNLLGVSSKLKLLRTVLCNSQEELDGEYSVYTEMGYEGQMIRIGSSAYENKRTKTLIKRKEFIDEEYQVLDILEGNGNWAGAAKHVYARLKDRTDCFTGIRGTKEYLTKVLAEKAKYIGGEGTVRYQNRTPDGKPRFPVTIALYGGKRDV